MREWEGSSSQERVDCNRTRAQYTDAVGAFFTDWRFDFRACNVTKNTSITGDEIGNVK